MFKRILIANRGEIACRVIATCRRMGIETVAVYSDADAGALHVEMADEAVRIGPAPVSESYLLGDVILQVALDRGAEAIHPGYGFLSENADFAQAVSDAGLIFIGPTPEAIRAMGLKDAAKALMQKADVPVVPGYHGAAQDLETLAQEADKIGYPVLIKARAGGGGKGMRLVEQPSDFKDSLEAAQREGQASFGDPHCLIEKYVTRPRHIEVQVFGDTHGTVVHLFERDCSLQRRHQKVIEEAPAPDMPADVRDAMGRAAAAAAKAIGYVGAGTIEFIVDGAGPLRTDGFWFMEMNTRLQVEHPVTEAITGFDLVALQLSVAAGEPLGVSQEDVNATGWAVEARLYAEDVPKGFLPAAGTLDALCFPPTVMFETGNLRVDSGVRAGDQVSPHYDPMIAKLIAHGPDRATAFATLQRALGQVDVAGLTTNRDFLIALCRNEAVLAGQVETGLIAATPELTAAPKPTDLHIAVAAVAGLASESGKTDPFDVLRGFSIGPSVPQTQTVIYSGVVHSVLIETVDASRWRVGDLTVQAIGPDLYKVDSHEGLQTLRAVAQGRTVTVIDTQSTLAFVRPDPCHRDGADGQTGDAILAPMTGVVRCVTAVVGQQVSKGDSLVVLEAMKMEHSLTAPRDGRVAQVLAVEGDQMADGTVLITLEPVDD